MQPGQLTICFSLYIVLGCSGSTWTTGSSTIGSTGSFVMFTRLDVALDLGLDLGLGISSLISSLIGSYLIGSSLLLIISTICSLVSSTDIFD